jgi:hypothetical protein
MSGKAVDTVLCFSTQGGAGAFPQTLAATTGDSLQVRGTVGESKAHLMAMIMESDAAGNKFRLTSPLLHDPNTGLTFVNPENPTQFSVPEYTSVELNEQDQLTVQGQCGAATTITAGLVIAYDDIRGTDADLHRWNDIRDDIKYLKSVEIDLAAIAVGAWTDTPIINTENQLHANASYAVLGYTVTPAVTMIGIKGVATGNLRMCGPGFPGTISLSQYFVEMSELHQRAYIPVFQANDRNAVFISAANSAALGANAAKVSLWLAELKTRK